MGLRLPARCAAVLGTLTLLLLTGCGSLRPGASDAERADEVSSRYAAMKRRLFPRVPDTTVAGWLALSEQQPTVLVDVREPQERQVSMLPGALSRQEFERTKDRYRSSIVVPYCTIGLRSGLYARQLMGEGFAVRNLAGSVLAWAHADQPFEVDGLPTRRVHVYSADWNLLPRSHEAVVTGRS